MAVDLNQTRIDPEAPEWQPLLANLQCNILKGHGRDHAVHIFLRFKAGANEVKAWIRDVRRGIPYGKPGQGPAGNCIGLLFMCYQADINFQFEFIQRTWADNPNFPRNLILPETGDDPLIGQDTDRSAAQKWPTVWNAPERKRSNFGGFITLKGGEYFFAPSLSFLRAI